MKKIRLNLQDLETNYSAFSRDESNAIKGGDSFTDWFNAAEPGVYTFAAGYAQDAGLAAAYSGLASYGVTGGYTGYGGYNGHNTAPSYYMNKSTGTLLTGYAAGADAGDDSKYFKMTFSNTTNGLVYAAEAGVNGIKLILNAGIWAWEKL